MQPMKVIISRSQKVLLTITDKVNLVGQVILLLLVLLIIVDVVMRRVFNSPLSGTLEVSEIMLVVVVFTSVAYCGIRKGHVSIDALTSRFRRRTQAVIDSITGIFGVIVFITMGCGSFVLGLNLLKTHRITGMLPIPIYPFSFIVGIGSLLLALVLLVQLAETILKVLKK
jgi:TRAP-type C4-dicarboxylate transport system permease small subunit